MYIPQEITDKILDYCVFVRHDITSLFFLFFFLFLLFCVMHSNLCFGRNNQILSSGYYFLIVLMHRHCHIVILDSCNHVEPSLIAFADRFSGASRLVYGLMKSVNSFLYNATNIIFIHYLFTYIFISNAGHCHIY